MKRIRTAVVGLGRIGWRFHIPQIVEHAGFELIGVVDPLRERLDEAKKEFGIKGYRDLVSLFKKVIPDLVVIASPTQFHAEQTINAFKHGCNVFCDKPMAPSLDDADRMIAAMKSAARKLMIYQPQRGPSEVVALQEILKRGLIGPVFMIKRACSSYARRNDWQALRKHGGGMLNNYGAHYIDQALHIARSPARRITCSLRTIASLGDADDVVKAVIETKNGAILDIDINMACAQPIPAWHILGKRGGTVLEEDEQVWKTRFFLEEELTDVSLQNGLAASDRRYGSGETIPWREETLSVAQFQQIDFYANCYGYFALDEKPFVPIDESRELMRVLDVCRKSAEE